MIAGRLTRRLSNLPQNATRLANVRAIYNNPEWVNFLSEETRRQRVQFLERELLQPKNSKSANNSSSNYLETISLNRPTLSIFNLKEFRTWLHKKSMQKDQVFMYERNSNLGNDLGAATFITHRGGRVRFKGQSEWIGIDQKDQIPSAYNANYIVEALDLNGYQLQYEGLDNILGLLHLKWLSFHGCSDFDDWCLDKISMQYPRLEYLDISECARVTERGLESLYKMPSLKTLIVTDYHNTGAMELTCILLEDVNPYLKVEIKQPDTRQIKDV